MNTNNTMTLYGVVQKIEDLDATGNLLTIVQAETNEIWEAVIDSKNLDRELIVEGLHVSVRGQRATIANNGIFAESIDEWGRYCDVCGRHMAEGYIVGDVEHACSEECAIVLYGGNEQAFRDDLALLDFDETADNAPTFWTEWD